MNTTDIILLVPLLFGVYKGYQKGLFIEIIGILAFIIALVTGFKFLGYGMNLLSPHIGEGMAGRFLPYLSFGVIFFPTIFMINKLGWNMRRALRFTILGTLDSFAGGLLGAFTWVFGISTLLWLLSTIGIHFPEKYTKDSVFLPHIEQVAPTVISRVSDWIPAGGNIIEKWRNESAAKETAAR